MVDCTVFDNVDDILGRYSILEEKVFSDEDWKIIMVMN